MKSPELEILERRMRRAINRFNQAQETERNMVHRPVLRRMVGQCFVYRNRYSGGESWPLYSRIVSINDKTLSFTTTEFQRMVDKRIEIREGCEHTYGEHIPYGVDEGWTPIPLKEYNTACTGILRQVHSLLKRVPKK